MLVGVRIEEQTLLFFDITINLALHEKVALGRQAGSRAARAGRKVGVGDVRNDPISRDAGYRVPPGLSSFLDLTKTRRKLPI